MDIHFCSEATVPALTDGPVSDSSEEGVHYCMAQSELEVSVSDAGAPVHGLFVWSLGIQSWFISGSLHVRHTIMLLSEPVLGLLLLPLGDHLFDVR